MDLDALSGIIAYKHTGDHVMTVTAGLDRIVIKNQLTKICDLELSGEVTFATGRSSMEISCQVAKAPEQGAHRTPDDVLLTCTFTMVSLDPNTKKPVAIAPLQIDTAEEQNIYDQGERNYQAKKAMAKVNLRKTTPNDEESDLIHELWLRQLEYHGQSRRRKNCNYDLLTWALRFKFIDNQAKQCHIHGEYKTALCADHAAPGPSQPASMCPKPVCADSSSTVTDIIL